MSFSRPYFVYPHLVRDTAVGGYDGALEGANVGASEGELDGAKIGAIEGVSVAAWSTSARARATTGARCRRRTR